MLAGTSAERGDDRGPLLLRLLALALGKRLALLGISEPAPPLLNAHLCLLEVGEGVGGLGPSRLKFDAVVLVGRVLRAEPLLQNLDLAVEPGELLTEAVVVLKQFTDPVPAGLVVCVVRHGQPIVGRSSFGVASTTELCRPRDVGPGSLLDCP